MVARQSSFAERPDFLRRRIVKSAACALVGLSALATACSGVPDEEADALGLVEGFAGVVVADEPRAAVIARDVLGNGGTAADAAVAMYFAMSVTLPSRVGLGGGGACLVFDSSEAEAEALLFLPQPVAGGGIPPRGPRAMAALHARHGLTRWGLLVNPAETLARFGHPVSRAFARDLDRAAARIAASPELAALFRNNAGQLPKEGDKITQIELSGVLSGLRAQGAGYLTNSVFMDRFIDGAAAAGQRLTNQEIRDAVPRFAAPLMLSLGDDSLYFTPPPAAGGLVAAQLWQLLNEEAGLAEAGSSARAHQFLEAAARAFADGGNWTAADGDAGTVSAALLADDHLESLWNGHDAGRHRPAPPAAPVAAPPYGASFVVVDRWDNAVACSFTMNGLFGAYRTAAGTGILLPAVPAPGTATALAPSAALLANQATGEVYLAAAASGGSAAPTALVELLLGRLHDEASLEEVQARPRLHTTGSPDVAYYEADVPSELRQSLADKGHDLQEAPPLGRVTAIYCEYSAHISRGDCEYARDPRGWGLGLLAQ